MCVGLRRITILRYLEVEKDHDLVLLDDVAHGFGDFDDRMFLQLKNTAGHTVRVQLKNIASQTVWVCVTLANIRG